MPSSPSTSADIGIRLPNARAGAPYDAPIDAGGSAAGLIIDQVLVPDGLALAFDAAGGRLQGTPATPGEYAITVVFRHAGSPGQAQRATITLTVTPDPRTLWKNLPSDRADPYWRADEDSCSLRGAALSIVAASKRGRSHAHAGGFRDDDVRIGHLAAGGWYVAVVADGAGSARYSRRGAALICEEASRRVLAALADGAGVQVDALAEDYALGVDAARPGEQLHTTLARIVGNAAYYAARAIHDEIAARPDLNGELRDYASTALIAICKRYPFGTLCVAWWVGDGAIGAYSKGGGVTLLGDVDSGEFAGQTRFLDNAAVGHDALRARTRFALVPDMTALVLMTDGVSDAKFETEARLARAADWDAFWTELDGAIGFADAGADHERRLLEWLDFWSQGNHDDRTIAIIH